MSRSRSLPADRRAVSVTVTHVLTIGITTILISGLLIGTGTLLDSQKDRATYAEKSTIGDRLATEITGVDQAAQGADGDISIKAEHPRRLSGGQYFVTLSEDCEVWERDHCLELTSDQTDAVEIPLRLDTDPGTDTLGEPVQGGDIWIHYDSAADELSLTEDRPT